MYLYNIFSRIQGIYILQQVLIYKYYYINLLITVVKAKETFRKKACDRDQIATGSIANVSSEVFQNFKSTHFKNMDKLYDGL